MGATSQLCRSNPPVQQDEGPTRRTLQDCPEARASCEFRFQEKAIQPVHKVLWRDRALRLRQCPLPCLYVGIHIGTRRPRFPWPAGLTFGPGTDKIIASHGGIESACVGWPGLGDLVEAEEHQELLRGWAAMRTLLVTIVVVAIASMTQARVWTTSTAVMRRRLWPRSIRTTRRCIETSWWARDLRSSSSRMPAHTGRANCNPRWRTSRYFSLDGRGYDARTSDLCRLLPSGSRQVRRAHGISTKLKFAGCTVQDQCAGVCSRRLVHP